MQRLLPGCRGCCLDAEAAARVQMLEATADSSLCLSMLGLQPRLHPALAIGAALSLEQLPPTLACPCPDPDPAQAWRTPHPPERGNWWLGQQPLVHTGFLHSWVVNGLNRRVLDKLQSIVAAGGSRPWRIITTGHS